MLADRLIKGLLLPPGGQETPLDPREVSLAGRVREAIDSVRGTDWMNPGQPLVPVAPTGTLPRAWDYPFGSNLYFQPRQEQPGRASFEQLRALADNYDVLRLCIETRKQQICEMPWSFRVERQPGEKKTDYTLRNEADPRVQDLTRFFKRPDRQHSWQQWLKMVLEEVFVIDALSIWPTRSTAGEVIALNLVDGATIKPLHDTQGWMPAPPNPAFQQIIKGMPALNMSTNELIYAPANPRVQMFYGYGPVEQIIMTVNIALRRQMSQLAYYTDGNVPEMIVQMPPTWQTDQIRQFQAWFDTLSGDLEARRRVRFIPETKGITPTKDAMLKDEFDEWLARVCCYAFSLPPTPFIKQMNRATAQQAQETATEEGKLPMLNWLADLFTFIAQTYMGYPGIEFAWNTEADVDRNIQSQIDDRDIKNGSRSIDEVREARGDEPLGVPPFIMTTQGPILLSQIASGEYAAMMQDRGAGAGSGDQEGDSEEEVGKMLRLLKAGRKKKVTRY